MTKKTGLTLERHRELGLELSNLHGRICDLIVELSPAYLNTGREMRGVRRLQNALILLRCYLDSAFSSEHPKMFTPDTYYGAAKRREAELEERESGGGLLVVDCWWSNVFGLRQEEGQRDPGKREKRDDS